MEEMRRECAFFALPADITISYSSLRSAIQEVNACKQACKKRVLERIAEAEQKRRKAEEEVIAANLYRNILEDLNAVHDGREATGIWEVDELLRPSAIKPMCEGNIIKDVARFAREDGLQCIVTATKVQNGRHYSKDGFKCASSLLKSNDSGVTK